MKVLRTALFSAFLMICFTTVGYSQHVNMPQINSGEIEINIVGAYVYATAPQSVELSYNIDAPPSSTITFRDQSSGTVLFTGSLSDYPSFALVQVNVPDAIGTLLECEVCLPFGNNCAKQGCITALDGNASPPTNPPTNQ